MSENDKLNCIYEKMFANSDQGVLNNIVSSGSCFEQYCFRIVFWTIFFLGSCLEQYCFSIVSWTILFQDRVLNNIVFRIVSWTILFLGSCLEQYCFTCILNKKSFIKTILKSSINSHVFGDTLYIDNTLCFFVTHY